MKCIGCGSVLQSENPSGLGYVNQKTLDAAIVAGDDIDIYCQRCFRMKNYNDSGEINVDRKDFKDLINEISNQEPQHLIYVVDVIDLENGLISNLSRKFLDWDITVVINKIDLLPRSIPKFKLEQRITKRLKQNGINPDNIIFVSAIKNQGIDEIADNINYYIEQKGEDSYLFGTANAGKSTILNHLLRANGVKEDIITTSYFPGTTIGTITIPIANGNLIDTPGIIKENTMLNKIDQSNFKQVIPQSEIKPKSFQLNPDQAIFFEGLGYMIFEGPNPGNVVVNVSNRIELHRTKAENIERIWQNRYDDLFKVKLSDKNAMESKTYKVADSAEDLVIPGLGWVRTSENTKIKFVLPKDINVISRKAII